MSRTVIKDVQIVRPEGLTAGDLLIEDGRIARLGGVIDAASAEEVAGEGLHLLPGLIDPHVHFREPGLTHKESIQSGSAAAVRGGVTSFVDMPNTRPATISQQALNAKLEAAAGRSWCHYGFFIGATTSNLDALVRARRTPGIKIFVGSSTGDMLVDDQATLERIFAETTLPIATHCEDETMVRANAARLSGRADPATHSLVRTPEAAARSVTRIVDLAIRHRHRTHILHLSSRAELEALDGAPWVTAEACIPHLFLDTDAYDRLGNFAVVNPALRRPNERLALWEALRAGRLANVSTDHAPHTPDEKKRPYPQAPSGIPSIENSLALMLDAHRRGQIRLETVVSLMCEGPARIWNLAGKGRIAEGYDADLVLVDLGLEKTIRDADQWTRCGWSPFAGLTLTGWPVQTWVAGRTVVRDDALVGKPSGLPLAFGRAGNAG